MRRLITSSSALLTLAFIVGAIFTSLTGGHFDTSTLSIPEADARQAVFLQPSPTTAQQRSRLTLPLRNPSIVVLKSKRQLHLYSDGAVVRTYQIGLGLSPIADKERQGDRRTPEGEFYIFTKNPKSAFYLSLGVSYPNAEDAARGLRSGLISRLQHDAIVRAIKRKVTPPQNTALGGDIYIHGNGASSDWTWGCVALENDDIKELFDAVPAGTPVTIRP